MQGRLLVVATVDDDRAAPLPSTLERRDAKTLSETAEQRRPESTPENSGAPTGSTCSWPITAKHSIQCNLMLQDKFALQYVWVSVHVCCTQTHASA